MPKYYSNITALAPECLHFSNYWTVTELYGWKDNLILGMIMRKLRPRKAKET